MINDHDTVISNSWLYCEDQTNAADVESIDSILAQATGSGISVINASGDTGNACDSEGSIAVPADSPHATAVGGASVKLAPGAVLDSLTWWDSSGSTPPGGSGGFGVSQFFATPTYQNPLNSSAMRSVPDLVLPADPTQGVQICQADAGGCPTGLVYGGTSNSAPMLAAIVAQLNQDLGKNLGELNPLIYPFAATVAFHDAAALKSDFAHVGLGAVNVDALDLALASKTVGLPDATQSIVDGTPSAGGGIPEFVPADGATKALVTVQLLDANDHSVAGKTISLTPNSGTSANISPASAISDGNGYVVFTLTDLTPEEVTLTASDETDSVTMNQTESVFFLVPPASSAGLNAFPNQVTADGVSQTQITITVQDSLGRPTPGKQIQLSQEGNSIISGPNPPVTDSSGQIVFTALDNHDETVTYSAIDVTDGNLPFPETGWSRSIIHPALHARPGARSLRPATSCRSPPVSKRRTSGRAASIGVPVPVRSARRSTLQEISTSRISSTAISTSFRPPVAWRIPGRG